MRQKMLAALKYPQSYVAECISRKECPHDGLFVLSSDRCQLCDLRRECHWKTSINKFEDIDAKPIHAVHATLLYGLSLIEGYIRRMHHDAETCNCESCTWTRNAQQLERSFRALSLGDRYRSVY